MDEQKKITDLCRQIVAEADEVVSVGIHLTAINAQHLQRIQRAAEQIAAEVNRPKEVKTDG